MTRAGIKVATVAAAVLSVGVLGAGNASAATIGAAGSAVDKVPTAAYQMCGTAYVGAKSHIGAPPAGAKAVQGVKVNASLPGWSASAVTGADGGYCLQGDKTMADAVQAGGVVALSIDPADVTVGGFTGALTDTSVNTGEFFAHRYPVSALFPDRAFRFHVVYS
ncbi:hypothetical protein [Prescottella agglutinans]|uniref:hypothetical protein n=1 Tax=Prescottella agglutinans TaxID=1644129 RepID=UPI003D96C2D4